MSISTTSPTFVRRLGLLLTDAAGNGLDLSQFRVSFNVEAADVEHPNSAVIRVHNLSADTMARIQGEFQLVTLSAGYEGTNPYAVIFSGSIKQFRKGKSDAVTTYLDILASDGDIAYNNSFIARTLNAGHTPAQEIEAAIESMNKAIAAANANIPNMTLATPVQTLAGGVIPAKRGKVMFGMARDTVRSAASRMQATWSIQNGKLTVIPYAGYLQTGTVIQLSQFTGVVGIPEATDEGIKIKTLLNPNLAVGCLVKIDEKLVNQTLYANGLPPVPYNRYTGIQLYANTTRDGLYRVFVVEHEGDTRAQPWYSNLTCLAMSPSTKEVVTGSD